jgi:hypothetical protein
MTVWVIDQLISATQVGQPTVRQPADANNRLAEQSDPCPDCSKDPGGDPNQNYRVNRTMR